jgi:hypothetical protein
MTATLTLTKAPQAPVVPELDRPDAAQMGDEILLASAAATKVARVRGGDSRRTETFVRAWTRSGNVD